MFPTSRCCAVRGCVGLPGDVALPVLCSLDQPTLHITKQVIECDCSFIATTDVSSVVSNGNIGQHEVGDGVGAAAAGGAIDADDMVTFLNATDGAAAPLRPRALRSRTVSCSSEAARPGGKAGVGGAGVREGDGAAAAARQVAVSEEDIKEYQQAICYFREFLAKGHPDLGRRGPICPFVFVLLVLF